MNRRQFLKSAAQFAIAAPVAAMVPTQAKGGVMPAYRVSQKDFGPCVSTYTIRPAFSSQLPVSFGEVWVHGPEGIIKIAYPNK